MAAKNEFEAGPPSKLSTTAAVIAAHAGWWRNSAATVNRSEVMRWPHAAGFCREPLASSTGSQTNPRHGG